MNTFSLFFRIMAKPPFNSFLLQELLLAKTLLFFFYFLLNTISFVHQLERNTVPGTWWQHKWSCLTMSLMSSLRAFSHGVQSEVWIPKVPRGQCCITMTSAHKLLEHALKQTRAATQTDTHEQSIFPGLLALWAIVCLHWSGLCQWQNNDEI